jgi:hypothetical protein
VRAASSIAVGRIHKRRMLFRCVERHHLDAPLRPSLHERKTNRRVPSAYHRLVGTKRESLILKGFLHFEMVRAFIENRTRIALNSLAIPAETPEALSANRLGRLTHLTAFSATKGLP